LFVGRKPEMARLEEMYSSEHFEFAVVYGRRRVGKTTLVNEFCLGKKTIYFVGIESTEKENLESFSRAVLEVSLPGSDIPPFQTFDALFDHIHQMAQRERVVLFIDEYPYLAQAKPAISSVLQAFVDRKFKDGKLFLILCGSSMSFMEHQVLGAGSPLYGRRTAQFKVLPFTFFETREMLPSFPPESQAVLFGATGGIPEYLSRIDGRLSLKENLVRLFFRPSGRLFEEPSNLLKQELRNPAAYNAIITAIADGASRLADISGKVGIPASACSNLLSSLIVLGLVRKDIPVTEKISRRTVYVLDDPMFRFWYRFVYPNLNSLMAGHADEVYEKKVKPQMEAFTGPVFERICLEYLTRRLLPGDLPFWSSHIGRWWGTNPTAMKEVEIDILAFEDEKALFCECKWTNHLVGLDVLDALRTKSGLFPYTDRYYHLYAKRGFTTGCRNAASEDPKVKLICFEDLIR
jgi:AAA+ ATPase superfamily predicted ATPase